MRGSEVDELDILTQVKFDEAAAALGSLPSRSGLAQDRTRAGLELTATVTHLRGVLEETNAEIGTQSKALEKFAMDSSI